MALVVKDRVKETSTSTGTGSFTLSGAVAGFQTFASTLTNGDTTYYAITDAGTGDFEVGLGTYNSGVLTRDTVLETHNGLAFVDFNAGEKEVFITYPADKAVYLDADGKVAPTTALMDTIKANDGAGSGLNADLLDGLQASDFVLKAGDTVAGDLTISGDLTVNGTTTTVNATNLAIADNMIYMNDGSTVTNPDLGWSGNYNDGTYAHAGFFRDATDGRFKAYDGYTPEPDASPYIDTSHASFSLADIEANTFYGNLTGTATNANKWTTARTITLGGDLTGSVSIDGTANVVLTAAINDDSHFHVISNIDGLQAALDAKADDTTLISAGTGLTGGGSIGVNRTLSLDTAYTDGRYVNATGDTMTGTLTAPTLKVSNDASDTAAHRLSVYDSGSVSYGMMLWNSNGASGEWSTMIYGPNQSGRRISFGKINNTVFSNHSDVTEIAYFDLDDSTLRLDADAYVGANRVFHDGYHPNADKWTTARTLTLNGDVSGSVAWDGSGNVTLTTTVANDSHSHTSLGTVNFNNGNLNNVNHITINDPGPGEGLEWLGGSGWKIYESPDDLTTNTGGNLQFVTGSTRQMTLSGGSLWTASQGTIWGSGNDGSGSGLDADTLDGIQGSSFLRSDSTDSFSGSYLSFPSLSLGISNNNSDNGFGTYFRGSNTHFVLGLASGNTLYLNYGNSSGSMRSYGSWIHNEVSIGAPWGSSNDGSGSGLDADLLDGLQGSSYLRSDAVDTASGKITFSGGLEAQANFLSGAQNFDNLKLSGFYSLYNVSATGHVNAPFQYGAMLTAGNTAQGGGMAMQLAHERTGAGTYIRGMNDTNDTWYAWQRIFTNDYHPNADKLTTARNIALTGDVTGSANFDGSANISITATVADDSHNHIIANVDGLQAALDGKQAIDASIMQYRGTISSQDWNTFVDGTEAGIYGVVNMTGANKPPTYTYGVALNASVSGQGKFQLYAPHNGSEGGNGLYYRSGWNTDYDAWAEIWHSNNDGSGSGLDADLLDGQHGSYYYSPANPPAATAKNDIFWENGQTVTTNYTITNGKNAMSAGPITINSGVTVTVGDGEAWTVV